MTIIEAASGSIKTMADGTLRISVDVEPRHAQAAFALFGSPGTAMALAALKTAQERAEAPPPADPAPKAPERPQGPICRWLVMRCKEREFQEWCGVSSEAQAAEYVRNVCGVESRRDIDGNKAAEHAFQVIRGRYSKHLIARGKTVENAGA